MDKSKTKETAEVKVPESVSQIVGQMKEVIALKESFREEQMTFVKNLINKDLSENELYMFLLLAKRAGLNPFAKEIIAVVYYKNDPAKRTVNYIVTRDGKRAVGYRQGGIESIITSPIYTRVYQIATDRKSPEGQVIYEPSTVEVKPWEGGKLWGATCTVKRNGKEYTATVALNEYNTNENVWVKKPETMIKKVAESQALSMAVPELLGTYDEAEMPTEARQIASTIVEGGDEAATPELLATLKVLGADMGKEYTKQSATDEITRLNAEKAKKPKQKQIIDQNKEMEEATQK